MIKNKKVERVCFGTKQCSITSGICRGCKLKMECAKRRIGKLG